jgi:hypothetical protein
MLPPLRLSVILKSVNCSDRFQPRLCLRVLRADLREDAAQLVEVEGHGYNHPALIQGQKNGSSEDLEER